MYASNEFVTLSDLQIKALDKREYDCLIKTEDYLFPKDYVEYRNL